MVLKQGLNQLRAERPKVKLADSEANRLNFQSAEDEARSPAPLGAWVVHNTENEASTALECLMHMRDVELIMF